MNDQQQKPKGKPVPEGKPKRQPMTDAEKAARQQLKQANFVKLANKRVPAALKRLGYIRSLANKSTYDFTPEQADKICETLGTALQGIRTAFNGTKDQVNEFSL